MASSIVKIDLFSFGDSERPGSLAAIGSAFDADPRLRVERMDTGDPMRIKIESAREYLSGIESSEPLPRRVAFQRRARPGFVGDVDVRDEAPPSSPFPRRLWLSTSDLTWLEEQENADAFAMLAVRLASAFEAAFGFATHSKMPWQQQVEFYEASQRGEPAPPIPGPATDRDSLRDVYWLNVFGPAFVERFGNLLEGLGVRREPMSHGGLVVWATDTPFHYDEAIGSHRDYPWKRPFYDALGPDAFVHAGQRSTGNVPTWEDHSRLVRAA